MHFSPHSSHPPSTHQLTLPLTSSCLPFPLIQSFLPITPSPLPSSAFSPFFCPHHSPFIYSFPLLFTSFLHSSLSPLTLLFPFILSFLILQFFPLLTAFLPSLSPPLFPSLFPLLYRPKEHLKCEL